ncbi:IS3 family transposase [Vibrio sp. SCSIO 43136]|uniref:IS3 family transposase n=1 Tax=Vibrio sp. SCSIO 43136 TaxID=2819101 RepID=UPI0020753FFD|nr:IS3 family transposase [Vibrio sp. SCSIO 43136]USD64097.1 IS3 family transposase [Vibrio sp. SCSIO 43136]USD65669.1 IS3 family transposase [Vibrio sp. SCSIO 43136]USD65855.1 IS3 family transposase [Vibrio sp. SCSIO 43136]USD66009.1 IS3 family transposase [Vibrio sp. SCSIO 43136]USD66423.1 IS3 family transposase [Vibrio sp. SCSIO 43136]
MQVTSRRKYSEEFKRNAVKRSLESPDTVKSVAIALGISPKILSKWRATMTTRKKPAKPIPNKGPKKSLAQLEKENRELKKRLEMAEMENEFLKEGESLLRQPKRVRFEHIFKRTKNTLPVRLLCRWLNVSPAGYYKWRNRQQTTREQTNDTLLEFLKKESDDQHCIPGYRKLWEAAIASGFICNKKRVQRLLQSLGYRSIASKRRHGRAPRQEPMMAAYNLLNRQFDVKEPNRVWVSDITQVRCKEGWNYLCIILDLYSRKVVGWSTSRINNADLVIKTLNKAWKSRRPNGEKLMFHSDQGVQYRAFETIRWHRKRKVTISMSGKGNCWDNACSESFFAQYKKEWISNLGELSRQEMTVQSRQYIDSYYNPVRRHGALGGVSPNDFELMN